MPSDEHEPSGTQAESTRGPSKWHRRLEKAFRVYFYVLIAMVLAFGLPFGIHLTGVWERVVGIAVFVGFVPYLILGFVVILGTKWASSPRSWAQVWGLRLLTAGLARIALGLLILGLVILDLIPAWRLSGSEALAAFAFAGLGFVVMTVGLVLVFAALIGDIVRLARPGRRHPPSPLGT